MQVHRFQVEALLAPYVDSIWTFTTETGFSPNDIRTVLPDAKLELIVPIRGTMSSDIHQQKVSLPEGQIMLIGAKVEPAVLSSGPITNLGIEFRPGMAYRFLDVSMAELTNGVYPVGAIFGRMGMELQWQIENVLTLEEKVGLIQRFLIHRLHSLSNQDRLIDAAVSMIQSNSGLMPVKTLCRELGYSKRYLDRKFRERLGFSPKTLSRILRFQSVCNRLMMQQDSIALWKEFSDSYYDQAHFIKEFKYFTGFSPLNYAQQINEIEQAFYHP